MIDEQITTKQEWYDVVKYKDEIQSFVKRRKAELDTTSNMLALYNTFYRSVYMGSNETKVERYPHAAESFKVYKAAIVEACLQGYSALLEISGNDGNSVLKSPELKKEMTNQFKSVSLLEMLSADILDDWILKGEAVTFIKLKENKEEYRIKSKLTDAETGEELMSFTVKEGVTYSGVDVEHIDPLDFFVDAYDYEKDPRGCTKIIRSYISPKTLLTSNGYPLLSKSDKDAIIEHGKKNSGYIPYFNFGSTQTYDGRNRTQADQIEVLTFYGDYITNDNKVLSNIKAVLVEGRIASCQYNSVSTNRLIYAPYKIDRDTHRAISPLSCVLPANKLANRAIDLFLKNLDDISNPWMLYQKGSISAQQVKEAKRKREVEYNNLGAVPTFWTPPAIPPQSTELINVVTEQSKNVLGLNQYMAGDTSGSVRTARESAILYQKANARMRVETDAFSYKFLLPLFNSFYAFNRELALVANMPLKPIYADPTLNVTISTNASRADNEGEFNKLIQVLQLPIAQMIFSNLQPQQVTLAVRYIMAKAELTDGDNLLELFDENGEPTEIPIEPNLDEQGSVPPPVPQGQDTMSQINQMGGVPNVQGM